MFYLKERFLANVPRWSIVPVRAQQSVAEHSYYVSLYTHKICFILELSAPTTNNAVGFALRHDMDEIVSGDTPGPYKRAVVDDKRKKPVHDQIAEWLGPDYVAAGRPSELVKAVVKVADLMDEVSFLTLERRNGNTMIDGTYVSSSSRLSKALDHLIKVYSGYWTNTEAVERMYEYVAAYIAELEEHSFDLPECIDVG